MITRRFFLLSSFSCLFLSAYPRLSFAGCTQGDAVKSFNTNNTVPSNSKDIGAVIVSWYNLTVVVPLLISVATIMSNNPMLHTSEILHGVDMSYIIDKAMTSASPSDFFPSEHGGVAQFGGGIGGGGGSHLTDKPFKGN
ncbi:hypothetical protein ACQ3G4_12315 [bacterium BS0013]